VICNTLLHIKYKLNGLAEIHCRTTAKNLAGEGPEAMLGMLLMGAMLDNKD